MRRFGWDQLLLGVLLAGLAGSGFGCAWESGGGGSDSGVDGMETDYTPPSYPPGPYGTGYGDTVEDFAIDECICAGSQAQARTIHLSDYLEDKVTMVTVHSGWCPYCRQQAPSMEGIYQQYKVGGTDPQYQGLKIILALAQDDNYNSEYQTMLNFCCAYKRQYGMTFTVAIDPDGQTLGKYWSAEPLNMLLSARMRIRYQVAGVLEGSDVITGNIVGIIQESL